MGFFTTAIAALALGASAYSMINQSSRRPVTPKMPEPPKVEDVEAKAVETANVRRRAASRSQSIMTSPLGIGQEADVARRTLLGQ